MLWAFISHVVECLLALIWLQKHIGCHIDHVLRHKADNLCPFVSSHDARHQSKDEQLSCQKDGTTQDPRNLLVVATSVRVSKQVVSAAFGGDTPPNELTNNNKELYHEHLANGRWQENADRGHGTVDPNLAIAPFGVRLDDDPFSPRRSVGRDLLLFDFHGTVMRQS